MPTDADFKQHLCADIDGFSLHAAVRCAADDRQALEQLCRYITRPALANERVQTNTVGQVVLKLKTAWRDGTTHLVMLPLEFMQRLAAQVPRPRLHLILGVAGACTPSGASPWPGTASGLTIPIHHRSGGPQSRATGIGCARGFSGQMDVARRQGPTRR
jgi:Putative transposase